FIQRPIATALLMVGLLVGGLVTYPLLPVAALPNVNYPTLQVTTQQPGTDPQTMASSVTTPLELQFGEIPGLTQMTSASALGYAENILVQKISQVSGVGLVGIGGQQKPAIRVQVDPAALAARGISLEDVRTVLGQANVDLAKGTLNSPRQTYTLNTNDQLLKADEYANLVI